MALLALVRNFVPSHDIARSGGWEIADCVARSYDIEGMDVGTVGAGRIGQAVMRVGGWTKSGEITIPVSLSLGLLYLTYGPSRTPTRADAQALRRQAALHGPASPPAPSREGPRLHVPPEHGGARHAGRRRLAELPPVPGDTAHVQRTYGGGWGSKLFVLLSFHRTTLLL